MVVLVVCQSWLLCVESIAGFSVLVYTGVFIPDLDRTLWNFSFNQTLHSSILIEHVK